MPVATLCTYARVRCMRLMTRYVLQPIGLRCCGCC